MFAKPKGTNSTGNAEPKPITEVRTAKRITVFKSVIFSIMCLLMFVPFIGKLGAAKLGALYIFGDDGKKSGRTSGNVYMRNGRSRAMAFFAPVRNAYTLFIRSTFSSLSIAWRGLSDIEITSWNSFFYFTVDRFARPIKVFGKMAYIGLNTNILNVGGTVITTPPVGATAPHDTPISTISITTTQVKIDYVTNPQGSNTLVSCTSGLSAGVRKPQKSLFRNVTIVDSSVGVTVDIIAAYTAKFGIPIVGTRIFIEMKVVDISTGLVSQLSGANIVVS